MPIFTWDEDSGGGSVTLPDPSQVIKGVKYGPNNSLTGTFDLFAVNTNIDQDVVSIALEGLATWLRTNIAGLTVRDEWPYGNEKLIYPTVSLFTQQAKRMPLFPEVINVTDPDGDNKVIATEVVAEYDFKIQLDLWCRTKLERKQQLAKLLTAFNFQEVDATGENNPDGLTLILSDYFDMPVRYEVETHQHKDDEQAAERGERRETMTLIVNLREIRTRSYYAMSNIEAHSGVDTTQVNTDDLEETQI